MGLRDVPKSRSLLWSNLRGEGHESYARMAGFDCWFSGPIKQYSPHHPPAPPAKTRNLSTPLQPAAYCSHTRHTRGPDAGPGGATVGEGRFSSGVGNSAAGPARMVPPEPDPVQKRIVTGGLWATLLNFSVQRPPVTRDNRTAGGASARLCHLAGKISRDSAQAESKISAFENRSGAYVWVREHRKRRKAVFADQHQLNID
ncbi:hypothetical protein SAMN05428969_2771 [Devosia sp. YR412]|nr:hypothetical protein SAMN05428969_2771 [Devosia sp. YR412]